MHLESIRQLMRTAVFDAGGESIEGGFVDRWESYAWRATEELREAFKRDGFPAEAESFLEALATDPAAPIDAVAELIASLRRWTGGLVERLPRHPSARARLVAVESASRLGAGDLVVPLLGDEDPNVREAAVRGLGPAKVPGADEHRLRMLGDADPRVRAAAAAGLGFLRSPALAAALAEHLAAEGDPRARGAILRAVAGETQQACIHAASEKVGRRLGPLRSVLIDALADEDARTRVSVAGALRRFDGPEVATAMLARFRVEANRQVRIALASYEGYGSVRDAALPFLSGLLQSDPDATVRIAVADQLAAFGGDAAPAIRGAMADPRLARAAVMAMGAVGDLSDLPRLLRLFAAPGASSFRREIDSAIRGICAGATERANPDPRPTPEQSAEIRARMHAPAAPGPGPWPVGRVRDELGALPLHANAARLWGIRPDGVLVSLDHDSPRVDGEPEADPLTRFAVVVQGSLDHEFLTALIPRPPRWTHPCGHCGASGVDGDRECPDCRGLGWIHRSPPPIAVR